MDLVKSDINSFLRVNNRPTHKKVSVLHVDDDLDFLYLSKKFLEDISESRVTVKSLAYPQETFEVLSKNNYDVIVADYQMSNMDGLELLKELKKQNIDIPFIIFTGRGREEIAINALNLGADYYLNKGGDPLSQYRELLHIIDKVTKHKQTEENLKRSEKRYRELAELLPETVFETDEKMNIIYANNSGLLKFQYTQEDLLEEINIVQLTAPESKEQVATNIHRILRGETITGQEYVVCRKDGSTFPTIIFSNRIFKNGQISGLRGIIVDISERKKNEIALLESERNYRTLFQATPIGILTCDLKGNIQNINETALLFLGSPSEEETKKINLLEFPPLKAINFSSDLKHCIETSEKMFSETLYTSKWGKQTFFRYAGNPILDKEQKIIGVYCTLEDITEYKKVEEELIRQNEEISAYAQFISHDVSNKLHLIEGYLVLLEKEYSKSLLSSISKNIKSLIEIIKSSLELIDSRKNDEKEEEVDLNLLIDKISVNLIPKEIDFSHDNLPKVHCNKANISLIIQNLLENAIIHGNPNKIEITLKETEDWTEILFSNDGKIITTEDLEKIFEWGFSTKSGHIGLGLTIVKKLVEAHRWKLIVESSEKMTTFKIMIPKKNP